MKSSISAAQASILLDRATSLFQTGKLHEACEIYQQVLDTGHDNAEVYNAHGLVLKELFRFEDAIRSYNRAIELKADYAEAYYNRGNAIGSMRRFKDAIDSYNKAIDIKPDYAEAYYKRGVAFQLLQCYGDALSSYDRTIFIRPDYVEAYINRGIILQIQKKYEEALINFDRAIALKPDHVVTYNIRGMVLQFIKRHAEALLNFEQAIVLKPDFTEAYNNLGNLLLQLKRMEQALASYNLVIALRPDYAEAYNNRGSILYQLGRYEEALDNYEQAIALKPDYVEALNNRGITLQSLKHYEDALSSYDRAIALMPGYAEAHNNRGITLQYLQRYEYALSSYDQAIEINPDYCDAFYNRGIALSELKRYEDALVNFEQAIALKPDYAEAYNNLGNNLQQQKRYKEALGCYEYAIVLKPDYVEALNNRGSTLLSLKRYEDALSSCDQAIAFNSKYAEAYNNRGISLQHLKHFDDALSSYNQAIELNPDYADAYINRGNTFLDLRCPQDALENFNQAVALKSDYAKAYYNRGLIFNIMKRFGDALVDFNKVISLDVDCPYAHGYRLAAQMHICFWEDFDNRVIELIHLVEQGIMATVPFPLLAIPVSSKTILEYATKYVAENYLPATQTLWKGERYKHDRIRIGYFSAEFRSHSTAYLIAELIELHDRSQFEIIAFSFGTGQPDEMHARLVKAFDQFYDVSKQSDLEIAAMARNMEIDIAIDLVGFTGNSRTGIFALRPAPVQLNYHTYAATMGAPFIDYVIADPVVIPKEDFGFYSEKIVQLPNCYVVNDSKRPIADSIPTRSALGLPETGFVFCCFNNHYKFTPDVFSIWMRLLTKIDGSVLWLKGYGGTEAIKQNLCHEAKNRGVDPERLIFAAHLPMSEHLARHKHADLYLDTFYHGAGTTCNDALWAGLPVLTCYGKTLAGRVAASILSAVGLPELIAHSHEEYESMALNLAINSDTLAAIRHKLAANSRTFPLFNASMFARHIEAAFSVMWNRSQQGLAPEHIYVDP